MLRSSWASLKSCNWLIGLSSVSQASLALARGGDGRTTAPAGAGGVSPSQPTAETA